MVLTNRRVKQSSVIVLLHFSRVSIKISSEQVKILGVSSYFSLPLAQKIDGLQSIQIDSLTVSMLKFTGRLSWVPRRHQSKKSPSTSVGARAVERGGEGLYGRPPSLHPSADGVSS